MNRAKDQLLSREHIPLKRPFLGYFSTFPFTCSNQLFSMSCTCQCNILQSWRITDLVFSQPFNIWWCCWSHSLVWVACAGGTWECLWALCSTNQAFSLAFLQLTHNDVRSVGLCSFLQGGDSLHHHCIYICMANLHKPIWINLVGKTFRDLNALLKSPQALDILSLLLTLYVLSYSVVIHLGEVSSHEYYKLSFPQAQMQHNWKPGPREFLFTLIMPFCHRIFSPIFSMDLSFTSPLHLLIMNLTSPTCLRITTNRYSIFFTELWNKRALPGTDRKSDCDGSVITKDKKTLQTRCVKQLDQWKVMHWLEFPGARS